MQLPLHTLIKFYFQPTGTRNLKAAHQTTAGRRRDRGPPANKCNNLGPSQERTPLMEAHLNGNCAPDPSTEFWSLSSNINDTLIYVGNSKWPEITGRQ